MAKGRKKLPQEVLDLRGTARKDRDRSLQITGKKITSIEQCKGFVGIGILKSAEEKRIYFRKCRQLIALGVLEDTYLDQLIVYARNLSQYAEAIEHINAEGLYIVLKTYSEKLDKAGNVTKKETDTGVVINPWYKVSRHCETIIRQIGSNFGFSPFDRQKLRVEVEKENPLQKLFNQMNNIEDGEVIE